jgi:two-component system C4-dicarboxylate transport response regulator DctD
MFVDDEQEIRSAVAQGLSLRDFSVTCHDDAAVALREISAEFDGTVVSDLRMPGMDGLNLLKSVREIDADIPVILVTGHADVQLAVKAMRDGAYDFIEKPFAMADLASVVSHAIDKRRLVLENRNLRVALAERDGLQHMLVGRSATMVALRTDVAAAAATDVDVLIQGETGTGKEVVARALHRFSDRASGPFVAINCGALPAEIIESELFGHERGAFTGASAQRIGKFEHANGGIVFLDEIESMPLDLQVKLLRVIETRTIERLGANEPIALDIRILAATKRDLLAASHDGEFRADLYYRMNVANLQLPALRHHREDIVDLVTHLVDEAAVRYRRPLPDIGAALLSDLAQRDWPGNVRELRNVVDRIVIGLDPSEPDIAGEEPTLANHVEACERQVIQASLAAHQGRLKECYTALGVSRKTLYDKMVRYGLQRADFTAEVDEDG